PKMLGWVTEKIRQPLIAGGLVCDEEDARNAINAGVVALSDHEIPGSGTLAKKLL
ncbi:glycerol-3-phosphate responsive antiterminator, partial [Klebsiella pneumoniae]|nr:glycerol-3-phosphate responsive antiterminator [Klebsiella pneumoniae]